MNPENPNTIAPVAATVDNEKLLQVMFELASEVWVLRDRLNVLEHGLVVRQVLPEGALDGPVTQGRLKQQLSDDRAQFIARLLAAASTSARET
jgi:hypothetical protein